MSKPYLKDVNVLNVEALSSDGEIYTAEKRVQVVVEDQEQYLLMWHHMLALIMGLNSLYDVKLMTWITQNINFNDNTISLNKFYKKKIIYDTKAGKSTVEKSISSLVQKGFIVRDETCVRCAMYHVNPSYIWYGNVEKRNHKLKVVLEMLQYGQLPDKERQREDDIKRAVEYYKKQKEEGNKKKTK